MCCGSLMHGKERKRGGGRGRNERAGGGGGVKSITGGNQPFVSKDLGHFPHDKCLFVRKIKTANTRRVASLRVFKLVFEPLEVQQNKAPKYKGKSGPRCTPAFRPGSMIPQIPPRGIVLFGGTPLFRDSPLVRFTCS